MLIRFFSTVDLCRVAVTLVFSAALALAVIPPERDPALDPGYGWDWCNVPFYHRYNIPSPWEPTQRIGVDLSLEICTAKQQHDAGWELYHRRIDLKDELLYNQVNPLEPPQLAPDVFFTLYNRHTGVLRSFAWIGPSDVDFGDFFSIGLHVSDGDEEVFLGHGHFAYAGGGHAFPLADRFAGNTGNMMYFTKRHKREVWVVVETELSYDPYNHLTASGEEPPLLFFYQLLNHNEADIRLSGSMSLTLNQEVENSGGTLGAVMNSLWKNRDAVSDGAASAEKLKTTLEGRVSRLSDKNPLKASFSKLLTGLGDVGSYGVILGGAKLVSSFLNMGGSGSVSTFTGSMRLEGKITDETSGGIFKPYVSGSIFDKAPYYAKVHPERDERKLGLFNLREAPKFTVEFHVLDTRPGDRRTPHPCAGSAPNDDGFPQQISCKLILAFVHFQFTDPRNCDSLIINPQHGAVLEDVSFQPIMKPKASPRRRPPMQHLVVIPPTQGWTVLDGYAYPDAEPWFNGRSLPLLLGSWYDWTPIWEGNVVEAFVPFDMYVKMRFTFRIQGRPAGKDKIEIVKIYKADMTRVLAPETVPELETCAVPPLAPPWALRARGVNSNRDIQIEWRPSPSPLVVGYMVQRLTADGTATQVVKTTGVSALDNKVSVNGNLLYRVFAMDAAGNFSVPATTGISFGVIGKHPGWTIGGVYKPGEEVFNRGQLFRCRSVPGVRDCSVPWFEPGGSIYSEVAWEVVPMDLPAAMNPPGNATLAGRVQRLGWEQLADASRYLLWVGTAPGSRDVFEFEVGRRNETYVAVPASGRPIYTTVFAHVGGRWDLAASAIYQTPDLGDDACLGLEEWKLGVYEPGARVRHGGSEYECMMWPYSGWCGQAGYEPGVTLYWQQAWKLLGTCR